MRTGASVGWQCEGACKRRGSVTAGGRNRRPPAHDGARVCSTIPAVIGKLPALETLSFKSCKLSVVPHGCLPPSLRALILTSNAISARLPTVILVCARRRDVRCSCAIYPHTSISTYLYIYTSIYLYIYLYPSLSLSLYVCVCVSVRVCVCIHTSIHIHLYIYTCK